LHYVVSDPLHINDYLLLGWLEISLKKSLYKILLSVTLHINP